MGAVKQFFTDSATLGMCPVSQSTIEHLETLESSYAVDWIKYVEIPFLGYDKTIHYANGIALQSAERLIAEDMATEEIVAFVEDFGDFFDPSLSPCDRIAVVGFGLFYQSPQWAALSEQCDWANFWPVINRDGMLIGAAVETADLSEGWLNVSDAAMIKEEEAIAGNWLVDFVYGRAWPPKDLDDSGCLIRNPTN